MSDGTRRLAARGARGVVAAGNPLATEAAIEVLRSGGNAVDAAVTAAAVQSVVEMPWGGVGGDAFLLVKQAGGEIAAINGSGAAPRALSESTQMQLPRFGPLSVGVPGFVGALCAVVERFGSRPLAELLAPAVYFAREGFPVSPEVSRAIARLVAQAGCDLVDLLDGNGSEPGEVFRQPQLARTLEEVGKGGSEAFYGGRLANFLAGHLSDLGGLLSPDDFNNHSTEWVSPISVEYQEARVLTQPPVSLGCVLLLLLKMYQQLGLPPLAYDDQIRIDAMVRCKHTAFANLLGVLSDQPSATDAAKALLSPESVAALCEGLLDVPLAELARHPPRLAANFAPRPFPAQGGEDTTCLAVLDSAGTSVTLIHSLFNEFGSRVYEPNTGVLLNDRLANQRVGTGPGEIIGGRKPLHTLNSYLVERSDGLSLAGSTPGGRGQVQFNFQVIVNVLQSSMGFREAVAAPRWLSGAPRRPEPNDGLYLEEGFSVGLAERLRERGHPPQSASSDDSDLFGSVTMVGREPSGSLLAVADHRREATAASC